MEYMYIITWYGSVRWVLETTNRPYIFTEDNIVADLLVVFSRYSLKDLHSEHRFLRKLLIALEEDDAFNQWSKVYKRDPANIQTRAIFKNILRRAVGNAIEILNAEIKEEEEKAQI